VIKNLENQNISDKILATLKAVCKQDNITLDFLEIENDFFSWNQNLISGNKVAVPKFDNIKKSRAAVDLAACYLLFHDSKIHDEFSDFSEYEKKLFDAFEKIRVIGNVKNSYRGIIKNISYKIAQDTQGRFAEDAVALPILLLEEILQEKIVDEINVDKKFAPYLKKFAKKIANQKDFALETKGFIEFLRKEKEAEQNSAKSSQKNSPQDELSENDQKNEDVNFNEESPERQLQQAFGEEEKSVKKPEDENQNVKLEDDGLNLSQLKGSAPNVYEDKIEFKKSYKVFTNKFDEIILPQKLIEKKELELLRYSLELRINKLAAISKRLTIKLKKKLLSKKKSIITQSYDDGVLDRKRLTQLVIDPFSDNFCIKELHSEYNNTIVTLLLDNSGSMRGQPIVMSALACEIIARMLEKFAIKTEILGFTTSDWKGGRARKMWESQGRSANPGRLSDLRHIIYKSANSSFKKAKVNLGLMLKEGMLKENIDGEALLWAKSRLMQRDEKRKILLVISDGTPIDDSTNSANEQEILTDHLHHVIHLIEKHTKIEIVGVGIGHQVDNFYRNSISIRKAEDLGDVMIEKITTLI